MARHKTSPFEDMIVVVSKLPWWAGIVLAVISYVVLHIYASSPVGTLTGPDQMGNFVAKNLIRTLAMYGQIVIPLGFGFGALVSGIKGIRQKKLFEKVSSRSGISSLNEMSWEDFESLVSEYYRRNGFQATREGGYGPDGGIDLVLRRGSETHLVQCKQWKAYKVGVKQVREFYGVMSSRRAAGGYFITSGDYTNDALKFVRGLNLELVDGRKLREMIDVTRKMAGPLYSANNVYQLPVAPVCPKCGADMKKRVAQKGAHAGKEFWGCASFPKCNGIRPVEDIESSGGAHASGGQAAAVALPEKRKCPVCGAEMVLRQFQSGPRNGQYFYGCVPCKKGWPMEN